MGVCLPQYDMRFRCWMSVHMLGCEWGVTWGGKGVRGIEESYTQISLISMPKYSSYCRACASANIDIED